MSNRANFFIHLALAFLSVVLCVVHLAVAVYYGFFNPQVYSLTLAFVCAAGCIWLFCRMALHAIAAVGREVAANNRREQQRRELVAAMNEGFERALEAKPNGLYRRKAA